MSIPDPIHVVHIVNSLEPGGLENGVVNIVNRLHRSTFRSSVICLIREGEFAARLAAEVSVHSLERPDHFSFATIRRLSSDIDDEKPDVLHTHNLGPLIYGVAAKRFSKWKPRILHGEHAELTSEETALKQRLIRKICYRDSDVIHAVSASLCDQLQAFGVSKKKLRVTINGVDCDRFSPPSLIAKSAKRNDLQIPEEALVLGILGRFGPFKRHRMLIDAFDQIAEANPLLYLLLVGDQGSEKDNVLDRVMASPFSERIVWAGFQMDPVPYLQVMDLLVIPSVNEGLSNAMLEAMACGIPCLTHSSCGAADVIDNNENGFVRELEDDQTLAAILRDLTSERDCLEQVGAKARLKVANQFSLQSMIDTYENLYIEAASR